MVLGLRSRQSGGRRSGGFPRPRVFRGGWPFGRRFPRRRGFFRDRFRSRNGDDGGCGGRCRRLRRADGRFRRWHRRRHFLAFGRVNVDFLGRLHASRAHRPVTYLEPL